MLAHMLSPGAGKYPLLLHSLAFPTFARVLELLCCVWFAALGRVDPVTTSRDSPVKAIY